MPIPRTEKGRQTRLRIAHGAARLFAARGFQDTDISDICSEAGIATGGYYRHFSGLEEVLLEIPLILKERLLAAGFGECAGAAPEEKAAAVLERFFVFFRENADLFQTLRQSEFVAAAPARNFRDTWAKLLAECFFDAPETQEAEIFAQVFMGVQEFFAVKNIVWERRGVSPATCALLGRLCAGGIAGRKVPGFAALAQKALVRADGQSRLPPARDTRGRLLRAAEEVFGKAGFANAAVADICRRAGVAVGSFYLHFESKDAAFRELTSMLGADLLRRNYESAGGSASRTETELRSFAAFFSFVRAHGMGYRIIREMEFVHPRVARNYYGVLQAEYVKSMRRAAAKGEFFTEDYPNMSLALMGAGHMLGMRYVLYGSEAPDEELFGKIVSQVFFGIPQGREAIC
ncbi:MAG: TetR/AcrR family transcriptional regulator [Elusimicrobiales bacterium]|nr:TetR/AcrR family transcriptional regulator [Elusimicrobiales bacterium]